MHILILIEPTTEGRFRATAGEPFRVSAEADSADEAARALERMLRDRLHNGTQLALVDLGNGSEGPVATPLQLEPLPNDDWFFRTMREEIEANRRREDEGSG